MAMKLKNIAKGIYKAVDKPMSAVSKAAFGTSSRALGTIVGQGAIAGHELVTGKKPTGQWAKNIEASNRKLYGSPEKIIKTTAGATAELGVLTLAAMKAPKAIVTGAKTVATKPLSRLANPEVAHYRQELQNMLKQGATKQDFKALLKGEGLNAGRFKDPVSRVKILRNFLKTARVR